jgi:uncharacterized protein (DUF433 family)
MAIEGLEHYSKDDLIAELIHRETFVGIVIFCRGDAKAGRLEPGDTVLTKSWPLSRVGVEDLLKTGKSLVPDLFKNETPPTAPSLRLTVLESEGIPLQVDDSGAVRIADSRITLDLLVEQYDNGMTPESIVRAYDTLQLADVYAVIAFYLRHQDQVREYLARRREEAEQLRQEVESRQPRIGREELLARRAAQEKNHAPTGQ